MMGLPARASRPLAVLLLLAAGAAAQDGPGEGGAAAPHFTDVLEHSGITFRHHFIDSETGTVYRVSPYDHGSGVCVVDVNNDGLDDIYFLDFLGPAALYLNHGNFQFEDVTEKAGIAVDRALKVGAAFGDYDNDGDLDLYVTTTRAGNRLFQNQGDGTFVDVARKAGVAYNGHSSAPSWFDYDGDGDLDLFVCNIGKFTTDTISREANYFFSSLPEMPFGPAIDAPDSETPGEGCILYRNNGDGTFTDVTEAAGINARGWNGDAAAADIDLDGDLDLYVSNMFGRNHLFRNQGNGTFEDITAKGLVRTSWGGMGARFFDANGDAWPDLYVVDMHSDMVALPESPRDVKEKAKFDTLTGTQMVAGKLVSVGRNVIQKADDTKARSVLFGNTFFLNRGDGTFEEDSAAANLETWWPWGIAAGDFNNDGAEDLFVPSGMGYPFYFWSNRFFVNDGRAHFTECSMKAGLYLPAKGTTIQGAEINHKPFTRSSRTAAVSDLDNDGDLDLVVNNFNHEPYLYRNDSPPGHALRLRLRNHAKSPAFGTRVVVKAGGREISRQLANAEGYLTQSSAVLHVGLGAVDAVDQVEIHWLGVAKPQVVQHPALDKVVDVDQE